MAYMRHLYPKLDFVLTRCTGMTDDSSLLIHIMNLRIELTRYKTVKELVDLRNLKKFENLTVSGLINIATIHKQLFPHKKFLSAVLVNSPSLEKTIEVYALLASTHNLEINIFFNDLDGAIAWLGFSGNDRIELKRFLDAHAKQ